MPEYKLKVEKVHSKVSTIEPYLADVPVFDFKVKFFRLK